MCVAGFPVSSRYWAPYRHVCDFPIKIPSYLAIKAAKKIQISIGGFLSAIPDIVATPTPGCRDLIDAGSVSSSNLPLLAPDGEMQASPRGGH